MTDRDPTELERAVARAIELAIVATRELEDSDGISLAIARAAISAVFRHRHTNRYEPCPLCGFVVRDVAELPFVFDDEP